MPNTIPGIFKPIFDTWTPLDYKRATWRSRAGRNHLLPTWVGGHNRRLMAYLILQSYVDNASRYFLIPDQNNEAGFWESLQNNTDQREYGDANLLVQAIMAAVLGDDQEIHVDRADEYDPTLPDSPGEADQASADGDPETPSESDEDGYNDPDVVAAWKVQEKLREWADDEKLPSKLVETEEKAVSLGDGLYSLGWDSAKDRPRLRCWDPGFYFPVFDDFASDDDYPTKVHICFEIVPDFDEDPTEPNTQPEMIRVRRITYELVDLATLTDVQPYSVPYQSQKTTQTCLMTDGIWEVNRIQQKTTDFSGDADEYLTLADGTIVKDLDLGMDFIPVVHLPNTPAGAAHYGKSSLLPVTQLLDDIQQADSDLAKARTLTGSPMLAGNFAPGPVEVGPGKVLRTGNTDKGGEKITVVDAAAGLAEMRSAVSDLLERLQVNARTPDAVVGRIEGKREPSGIALAIKYGPLISMINHMRIVRQQKYSLLLKMVQRFYQLNGQLPAGDTHQAELVLGSFIPSDTNSVVTQVVQLLSSKPPAIDQETAAKMLIEGGVPIDDVSEMIRNIQHNDFTGGVNLLDATGDEQAVGEYLDRKIAPAPPPLELTLKNPQQAPERVVEPGSSSAQPQAQPPQP